MRDLKYVVIVYHETGDYEGPKVYGYCVPHTLKPGDKLRVLIRLMLPELARPSSFWAKKLHMVDWLHHGLFGGAYLNPESILNNGLYACYSGFRAITLHTFGV